MGFLDDLVTWGAVAALGYAAWKYKVQPELDRRKKAEQGITQQTTTVDKPKPKFIDAVFKVDGQDGQRKD